MEGKREELGDAVIWLGDLTSTRPRSVRTACRLVQFEIVLR